MLRETNERFSTTIIFIGHNIYERLCLQFKILHFEKEKCYDLKESLLKNTL